MSEKAADRLGVGGTQARPDLEFWRYCEQGQRPDVGGFIADAKIGNVPDVAALLRMGQCDRWPTGDRVLAEDYLESFPTVRADAECAFELIYSEFLLREEHGEAPNCDEFIERFPEHAARLRLQIELHLAIDDFENAGRDMARRADTGAAAIGPYKLLQQIGEGGMGTVYLAEQTHPVQRKVALKVIKAGMDSQQVIARFEAERQALALMDHVNIARVLDAGTTDSNGRIQTVELAGTLASAASGQPYFVMELVHGVPITKYCDNNHLTPRERLELFVPVCQAIQHAHQKGIIHRDIKPSNVMVTLYDGQPVPKVIDFGVAKATAQQLTERTLFTQYGAMVGTLEYMSPEQAELSALGVDTRSDIYSLGVLLYELLTGSTPLSRQRVRESAYAEVLRMIREEEPAKPSTRLSDSGESLASISAQRQMEPAKLTKLLRGELDWIVMKALEKDRDRRYDSASSFAADLQRYLNDEPVQACPPSAVYRLRKFVRRNKGPVLVGLTLAMLLVLGSVGTSIGLTRALRAERTATAAAVTADQQRQEAEIQRDRAQTAEKLATTRLSEVIREKDRATAAEVQAKEQAAVAEAVNDFLQNDLLAEAAPEENDRNAKVTVEELLDRAAARISGKFSEQPRVEMGIRLTIGDAYRALGNSPSAQLQFERALEVYHRVLGAEHPYTLAIMTKLAGLHLDQGQLAKAEQLYIQTLEARRRVLGDEHPDTLISVNNLAGLHQARGRYAQAEAHFLNALEGQRRLLGDEHADTLSTMNDLALLYSAQGHHSKAEPLLLKSLESRRLALGEGHPKTLVSMNNLANLYQYQERFDEAETLYVQSLEIRRRVLGEEHPGTLRLLNNLAGVYRRQRQFAKAEPLYAEALRVRLRILGEEHPDTLNSLNSLGQLYRDQGQFAKAEPLLVQSLEGRRRVLGEENPHTLTTTSNLAQLYESQRQFAKAEPLYVQALEGRRRQLGDEHSDTLTNMNTLGGFYRSQGQFAMAEPLFVQTLEIRRRLLGDKHQSTLSSMNNLAMLFWDMRRFSSAESLLREYLTIHEEHQPDDWNTFKAKSLLGACLLSQKNYADAEPLLAAGYEGMHQREDNIPVVSSFHLTKALERLVRLYDAWGKQDEADEWRIKLEAREAASKKSEAPDDK